MKHQIRKVLSVLLAVLLFAGVFSGCGKKDSGVVKIATKPMTEQFILSEMLAQLIEQDTAAAPPTSTPRSSRATSTSIPNTPGPPGRSS